MEEKISVILAFLKIKCILDLKVTFVILRIKDFITMNTAPSIFDWLSIALAMIGLLVSLIALKFALDSRGNSEMAEETAEEAVLTANNAVSTASAALSSASSSASSSSSSATAAAKSAETAQAILKQLTEAGAAAEIK